MKVPCRDCADRTAFCHGGCQKYADYVTEYNRTKAARKSDPYRLVTGYEIARMQKFRTVTARR